MINKKINSINIALWYYVLTTYNKSDFPMHIIEKLTSFLDFNYIPTGIFIHNENLLRVAHRSNITSERIIGIIAHKPELIDYMELDHFNFENKDVMGLLIQHPKLFEYFDVNLDAFSFIQLVRVYSENIDLKSRVNFDKFTLTASDIRAVFNGYLRKRHVIELLDLKSLDSNHTKIILEEYGEEFVDKVDVNVLKPGDWLNLLSKRPELVQWCNLKAFDKKDGIELARLIVMFEQFDYMVEQYKDLFNALAIEILIIHNPQKFLSMLDTKKLKEKNWLSIIKEQPYLRPKYIFESIT